MFSLLRYKPPKIPFHSFTHFRFVKFGVNSSPTVNSKEGGGRFFELFRSRFRNCIESEVNLSIPNDIRVYRLGYSVFFVDASWVDDQYVQLGLTSQSLYGQVLFAKSCRIDPRALIPDISPLFQSGDMTIAELCGFCYGVVTGIEYEIPYFDIFTDNTTVKRFLTRNSTNFYLMPEKQFLAVCAKELWFHSQSHGFGSVSWIASKKNHNANLLSRRDHSQLMRGKKGYRTFWGKVRDDLPLFKGSLVINLARLDNDGFKNAALVTKGLGFDVLADIALSMMVREHVGVGICSVAEHPFNGIITSLPKPGGGEFGKFYSLPALNDPRVVKLPYSIRILLESAIRNCDGFQVTKDDVEKIIDWENSAPKLTEILFKPARVLLQDFTGVPVVVDLAAMRDAMKNLNIDANKINPLVPVDFVIDHSVQVNVARSENAVQANMELEFQRNQEIFGFLKWGSTAFRNMLVVPPGSGIVHQVNLEYLGRVVFNTNGLLYPDSVVGTDSLTTMIDGLGVAGWGVGGIEAVATMLGQPMSMVLPGVVGFKMTGNLRDGVTATDLVLTVTQMLRKHGVVGKFVEFYGQGMSQLSLADRATIANMSPEYGATMGFFPVDHVTLDYLKLIGRADDTVSMIEHYLRANNMFVDYNEPQVERVYSSYLELDLAEVEPCMSGPKRPHDRVPLKDMKADWHGCLDNKVGFKGFAIPKDDQSKVVKFSFHGQPAELKHGSVVIAAITSCTNTSNPSVMLGAALVAKKACELGLEVKPWVKTSLAPGSGVVTKYLQKSGLQKYLDQQGFKHVDYGCTTFIGNSSDLDESVSAAISENDIVASAVLSGNRNFEGRVHPLTRANYLASPPLVVAYALAGTVDIDFENEPIGTGNDGKSVYFRDIWPSNEEIAQVVQSSVRPDMFKTTYEAITKGNPMWNSLEVPEGSLYQWDPESTYIHDPPYFKHMTFDPPGPHGVKGAYCLLYFGDSITTDHISPAGSIHRDSPAAKYLVEHGVDRKDFNSYGSHSGNDEVMARGTFANIRIVNKLLNGEVGPKTIHIPTGEKLYVFDAATRYKEAGHDTIIIAGAEYGSGSSRDWAAKGPMLQGVKAVIAKSFERIHRSNLVGMGVIPLCFKAGEDADTLGLTGHERYTIDLPSKVSELRPGQDVTVVTDSGKSFTCTVRFDTEVELAYFDHGGILPYVIRQLMRQ